jgi:hypothetical protein
VLAICEAIEVGGRDEPESREKVLLDVEKADQVEETGAFGDCINRIVGERDDAALVVWVRRSFHLKPEGTITTHVGDYEVAMVDVRLEAGGDELAVRAGENLRLDHQLGEGS